MSDNNKTHSDCPLPPPLSSVLDHAHAAPSDTPKRKNAVLIMALTGPVIISILVLAGMYVYFKLPIANSRTIYSGYATIDRIHDLEIECSPHLRRYRSEGDLLIDIKEEWDLTDDLVGIALNNGSIVDISVTAVDSKGVEYKRNHFGHSGNSARTSFTDIPWGRGIVDIRIHSSKPIHVTNVMWMDWNPE